MVSLECHGVNNRTSLHTHCIKITLPLSVALPNPPVRAYEAMKRLLLVSLAAAAVVAAAPGEMAHAGDADPPAPRTSPPQRRVQSPVRSREMSRKEGNAMVAHDHHEKRHLRDRKEGTKNRGHKSEKNATDAGQGVTLEEENMLLMASAADADAERGKSKKNKRKKKKEDIEPTQITFFTIPGDDDFKFFLNATGEDPIPIPANYTLPAGSYNFTYDNGSAIGHNFVVEVFASKSSKGKVLAQTDICKNCTNSTGIVKLKAHARAFFHCEPHEDGMGFNATVVKST